MSLLRNLLAYMSPSTLCILTDSSVVCMHTTCYKYMCDPACVTLGLCTRNTYSELV